MKLVVPSLANMRLVIRSAVAPIIILLSLLLLVAACSKANDRQDFEARAQATARESEAIDRTVASLLNSIAGDLSVGREPEWQRDMQRQIDAARALAEDWSQLSPPDEYDSYYAAMTRLLRLNVEEYELYKEAIAKLDGSLLAAANQLREDGRAALDEMRREAGLDVPTPTENEGYRVVVRQLNREFTVVEAELLKLSNQALETPNVIRDVTWQQAMDRQIRAGAAIWAEVESLSPPEQFSEYHAALNELLLVELEAYIYLFEGLVEDDSEKLDLATERFDEYPRKRQRMIDIATRLDMD